MKTTKAALTAEVRELLAKGEHGERNCAAHGKCIAEAVRRLQFHGAGSAELRGLSDTGLTAEDFSTMLYFNLPHPFGGEVCDYLDAM